MEDFTLLTTIGKGNFANVILAESKSDQQLYAIKTLRKDFLIENDEVKGPKTEKSVLMKAREFDHPFIVGLFSTFQTETRLCTVLEFCSGGDLMFQIQKGGFGFVRAR